MKKTYEGYWFRSHQDSASMWHYALYKEDNYYSHDDYDENETGRLPKSYVGCICTVILCKVKNLLLRKQYITVIIELSA